MGTNTLEHCFRRARALWLSRERAREDPLLGRAGLELATGPVFIPTFGTY
jgi:hypothetical protein